MDISWSRLVDLFKSHTFPSFEVLDHRDRGFCMHTKVHSRVRRVVRRVVRCSKSLLGTGMISPTWHAKLQRLGASISLKCPARYVVLEVCPPHVGVFICLLECFINLQHESNSDCSHYRNPIYTYLGASILGGSEVPGATISLNHNVQRNLQRLCHWCCVCSCAVGILSLGQDCRDRVQNQKIVPEHAGT